MSPTEETGRPKNTRKNTIDFGPSVTSDDVHFPFQRTEEQTFNALYPYPSIATRHEEIITWLITGKRHSRPESLYSDCWIAFNISTVEIQTLMSDLLVFESLTSVRWFCCMYSDMVRLPLYLTSRFFERQGRQHIEDGKTGGGYAGNEGVERRTHNWHVT